MGKNYHYLKVGHSYLCRGQNPALLVWFLLVRAKSLCLSSLTGAQGKQLVGVRRLIRFLLGRRGQAKEITLPVFGNFCLDVNGGHKVFDLRRKTVTKVFSNGVDAQALAEEIENARVAGGFPFAPTVRRWNTAERWYEEDFVAGTIAHLLETKSADGFLVDYFEHVAPCLEQLILLQEPRLIAVSEYVSGLTTGVDDATLRDAHLDAQSHAEVRRFIEETARHLEGQGRTKIALVFSHGDFSRQNILRIKGGIRCIDWESAKARSLLYDVYNYFFTELHYDRARSSMVRETTSAIDALRRQLSVKAPALGRNLDSLAAVYLRVYYLERVRTFLDRDLTDKMLEVALKSIRAFRQFDAALEREGAENPLPVRDRSRG